MNDSRGFRIPRLMSMLPLLLGSLVFLPSTLQARTWWNEAWSAREKITVDTTDNGLSVADPIGTTTVVVRLHDGNFDFSNSKEDGSDLRFVDSDDKTLLASQVEKFDTVMNLSLIHI